MSNLIVKKILNELPYRKNAIISKRLGGTVSAIQVKYVFNGCITNPDIVKPVLREARKLAKQNFRIPRKNILKKTA